MDLRQYQEEAEKTSGAYGSEVKEIRQLFALISLLGELGEFANLVKKKYRHGHGILDVELRAELGDVLWYLAETCSAFGFDMNQIAVQNLDKLQRRYPNGFSSEASKNRPE
jgi:NTP pyrophosphatase (non-canonical NTP hydrolase)